MRYLIVILCILLVFSLIGCTQQNEFISPVAFYYCAKDIDHKNGGDVFIKEYREGADFSSDVLLLFNEYLKGPANDGLYNPFPEGSYIKDAKRDGNALTLNLSEHFDKLPLDELAFATACLAQTAFEYTSVQVLLLIPSGTFIDGSTYKTFTSDSFIYSDQNISYAPLQ